MNAERPFDRLIVWAAARYDERVIEITVQSDGPEWVDDDRHLTTVAEMIIDPNVTYIITAHANHYYADRGTVGVAHTVEAPTLDEAAEAVLDVIAEFAAQDHP